MKRVIIRVLSAVIYSMVSFGCAIRVPYDSVGGYETRIEFSKNFRGTETYDFIVSNQGVTKLNDCLKKIDSISEENINLSVFAPCSNEKSITFDWLGLSDSIESKESNQSKTIRSLWVLVDFLRTLKIESKDAISIDIVLTKKSDSFKFEKELSQQHSINLMIAQYTDSLAGDRSLPARIIDTSAHEIMHILKLRSSGEISATDAYVIQQEYHAYLAGYCVTLKSGLVNDNRIIIDFIDFEDVDFDSLNYFNSEELLSHTKVTMTTSQGTSTRPLQYSELAKLLVQRDLLKVTGDDSIITLSEAQTAKVSDFCKFKLRSYLSST